MERRLGEFVSQSFVMLPTESDREFHLDIDNGYSIQTRFELTYIILKLSFFKPRPTVEALQNASLEMEEIVQEQTNALKWRVHSEIATVPKNVNGA